MRNTDEIIFLIKTYLEVNSPNSWDSDKFLYDLQNHECRDTEKEYFLSITDIRRKYVPMGMFTYYSNDLEELTQFADLLIQQFELKAISITIFRTTNFGGTAIYNDSPIGMVLSKSITD